MSISFNCVCGKPLRSKEEMAGRKTKCPHCGAILTIPGTCVKVATTAALAAKAESLNPAHPDAVRVEGLDWSSPEVPAVAISSESVLAPGDDLIRRLDPPRPDDGSEAVQSARPAGPQCLGEDQPGEHGGHAQRTRASRMDHEDRIRGQAFRGTRAATTRWS